ncbi:uncharacterized protein E5676_scaffold1933G00010 [Cucumis melo var. makuwa]|uniref:Uncharacterized protein n=1 Tax=Cucumis melo var. makuwa TaxID=1194695 RepID=A0A5D3C951_CUCMM|nr:uncharacterized protein E5676_scaffold1933G00010 [Cucumis melo var. makuwa]
MARACRQLLERVTSKDMANTCKEEFKYLLHIDEITSITCVPKGEQVWVLSAERLPPLKEKYYKSYKQQLQDIYGLVKFSHLHPKRRASVMFKALRGAHLNRTTIRVVKFTNPITGREMSRTLIHPQQCRSRLPQVLKMRERENLSHDFFSRAIRSSSEVRSYSGCIVGRVQFYTIEHDSRSTVLKSGVMVVGEDSGYRSVDNNFYDVLDEVLDVQYPLE